ncbi:MAG: DUF1499 domain-containing protein [Nevskiales bacterium]|nr:DUF1499 domain-containing protein [Nevskiales bacterium]
MSERGVAGSILSLVVLYGLAGCGLGQAHLRGADGRLAPCDRDRCVSSLSEDPAYAIEPLRYQGGRDHARQALMEVIEATPRLRVDAAQDDYIHATATSRIMRFVDDLELVFAEQPGRIDVRSASRLGYSDFGVNRERVEALRRQFEAQSP